MKRKAAHLLSKRTFSSAIAADGVSLRPLSKPFQANFRGFSEGEQDETYPLDQVVYTTKSGGLLEVQHDMEALAQVSASDWKTLWQNRTHNPRYAHGASGVWKHKEMVLPEMPDNRVLTLGEGNSQLLLAKRYGEAIGVDNVYIKQCGVSHSGSFKDLGMTALMSQAYNLFKDGRAGIRAVGCASSGDTSAAVSAFASYAGIPSVVFLPAGKVSLAQLVQPLSNGSKVFAMDTDFDGCMKCIKQLVSMCPVYLANSMNPLRLEGQKTSAFEIAHQMQWDVPDVLVVPSGNLGNVYAFYKGFKMMKDLGIVDRLPTILAAQSEKANPLFRAYNAGLPEACEPVQAQTTQASAIQIGNPVSYPRARQGLRETNGFVVQVTEEELMDATALGDRYGLFSCPHTGVGLAALQKCVASGKIGKTDRVVVVSTAHGLKFADSKVQYHKKELPDMACSLANQIHYVSPDPEAIVSIIMDATQTA